MAVVKEEEKNDDAEHYDGPRVQRIVDRENNATALLVPQEIWSRLMGEMDELEHSLAALKEQLAPAEKTKEQVKAELQAERDQLTSVPGILRVTDSANEFKAMVLSPQAWEELLEQLDDLEDLVAVYKEELNPSEYEPFEEAMIRVEAEWAARDLQNKNQ